MSVCVCLQAMRATSFSNPTEVTHYSLGDKRKRRFPVQGIYLYTRSNDQNRNKKPLSIYGTGPFMEHCQLLNFKTNV